LSLAKDELTRTPGLQPAGETWSPALLSVDSCAREPIHIPGAIQPHGALMAFDAAASTLLFASANLETWLPVGGRPIQGRALDEWVGEAAAAAIRQALLKPMGGALRHQVIDLPARPQHGQALALEAVVHQQQGIAIVEFEPASLAPGPSDWMQPFSEIVAALRKAADLHQLVQTIAQCVRGLTGFDRVMVYRFNESLDGQVVADAHASDMESLYDLHYPASDIPPQARELYRSNLVHYIADASYRPVPIHGLSDTAGAQPLDLSHSMLISASPILIESLRSMGVASTLTLSLLVDDRLWGLIICHHRSASALPVRLRRACCALSVASSYMVGWHARHDRADAARLHAQSQAEVIASFSQVQSALPDVVQSAAPALLRMAGARAGALWHGEKIHPFGRWPGAELGQLIVRCVRDEFERSGDDLYCTEHADLLPAIEPAELLQVCGLMAFRLDQAGTSGIVWLRPEYRREVKWGGNPDKPMQTELDAHGEPRVGPRTSFSRWATLVKERCRPWEALQMDAVRTLWPLQQVLATRDAVAQAGLQTERFRALVTLQSDIYWETDLTGHLLRLSKPLPNGHGPIAQRSLPELLAPACEAGALAALQEALQSRQEFRRLRIHGKRGSDGRRFDLLINGGPLHGDGGQFEGWHGTIVDVTRELGMQAALRQKEAAETDKLRGVALLAAGIAHDFNNLLGSINGLAELCELEAPAGSRQARNLGRIRQSGDRAAQLVRQLLDFSRQSPMAAQRMLASEWLAHAEDLLRAALPRRMPLAVVIDADGLLNIDLVQMEQVLLNLTRNAAHALRERSGAVRIVVDRVDPASAPGLASARHLRLRVIDNGEGMSSEVLAKVFNPFFTTKGVGEGTGLGLAAAHGIVANHDGVIEVRSELGIGTTFSIFLPLVGPCAADAARAPDPPDAPDAPHSRAADGKP